MELRPTAHDDLGLEAALTHYTEAWAERSGVAVSFHTSGADADRLPEPVETALYRVAQECLTNVLRHAKARRVGVLLQRLPDRAVAVVEDDGVGFDAGAAKPEAKGRGRLGLLGMRERLALVGGTLTIETARGRGTTVIASVPVARGSSGRPG